jgi:protein-tyrosine-phosphatase
MTGPRLHISFVCSYNRARSVMAAAVFSEQLRRRGLGDAVRVTSAGTRAVVGGPIDERTARVLLKHGYAAPANQRAAQLEDDHLSADLLVALGREHVGVLQKMGVDDDRIRYADVRNPCFGRDFENAYAAIQAMMPAIHAWVNQRLPLAEFETSAAKGNIAIGHRVMGLA